jgi:hypothetical protein
VPNGDGEQFDEGLGSVVKKYLSKLAAIFLG